MSKILYNKIIFKAMREKRQSQKIFKSYKIRENRLNIVLLIIIKIRV